ncbi:MAG: hypothetical protein EU542_03350 [Promethearchaeota archaeon]|jgi:hypothetical protein|nr:MAG: hypothetical protein EU542_03350 [Candidatus Lokiarchaeota archaeon]
MKDVEMINCPVCGTKFIPRTFYPEDAIFSTLDGKKLSGFNGYISSRGVKPQEVILSTWKTYCPNCNYILNFVKEIVRKEKLHIQKGISNDVSSKYNSYYFGFPFGDYTQYLKEVSKKMEDGIKSILKELDIETWENLYIIEDHFKFLVKFYANLEHYCDTKLGMKEEKDLIAKVRKLKLNENLEKHLLDLNVVKDKIIKGDYELSSSEQSTIRTVLVKFVLFLLKKQLESLINKKELLKGYEFLNRTDLESEIKSYISHYLYSTFNSDPKSKKQINIFLENIFEEAKV